MRFHPIDAEPGHGGGSGGSGGDDWFGGGGDDGGDDDGGDDGGQADNSDEEISIVEVEASEADAITQEPQEEPRQLLLQASGASPTSTIRFTTAFSEWPFPR